MYRLNLTLVLLFLAVQYSLNLSAYCISETFSYNSNRQDSIRAELLVDSALFFWRKGHLRKALFHYKNSLDLFKNANSWNNYIRASNRVGRLYYHLSYLEKAEFHLKESLSINVNLSSPKLKSFAKSHFWLGLVNYEKGDYFSADSLLNVCLETQLKFYSEESTELGLTYLNIADINSDLGFYEKAIQNYNASIDIFNNNNETYLLKSAISNKLTIFAQKGKINEYISESLKLVNYKNLQDVDYNIIMNIANIYNKYENIEEAIAILNSFLNKREFGNLDDYIKAEFYSLLGFSLAQNQNFIYAHHYLKKGLNIYLKAYGENSLHVANEYSQLGFLFFKKKNYHKSLRYYKKAINIYNKISSNHKSLAAIFFRKSLAILEIGDIPIARNILLKSLEMTSHFYSESSYKILEIKNNLCKADLIIGNYEKAIESIDSTFSYFFNSKESLEENKLIFLSMPQIYELLNSLIIKIDLLNALILSTNNSKLIKEKTNTYINISIIVNYLRKNYSSLNKKITFTSQKYNLFTGGLNSAIATSKITDPIFYKKLAYKFNGMNKAGILLESLNHSQARNFASLPDSLRDKERDLKIDITFYNNKLNEENSKQTPDSARVTYYENVLFDFNREYEALIDTLENKYPDYYDLKHRNYVASVDDVQKELLDDNAALVEYYYSDSAMYAFAITKNDYEVYELGVPKHFKQWLSNFRKAQTDARFLLDSATTANQLYFSSGHALYKHLLQPVLADLDSGITNLIIVPDGELGHINFETLLTDSVGSSSGSYADLPYLLKDYNIQYAYSATVLLSAKRHKRKAPAAFFAGFAPNYANLATTVAGDSSADQMVVELTRSGNYQLPGAISEVKNLAALTGGDAFINAAASERAFKQNADRYQVLHLAMHGLVNDRDAMYSKLLFTQTDDTLEDNYLNAAEIFNLDLSADLVVLSACNTGYGQVNRGEGIMSLSRAFKYAGSPSLVMSLWQIPDQPTSAIMNRFYENLIAGQRKDVALRNAKLDFLSANRGNLRSHPFYWAGLIPIGDMQPLAVESWIERNMLLLAGLLLLLIIAVLVSRRMHVTNKT